MMRIINLIKDVLNLDNIKQQRPNEDLIFNLNKSLKAVSKQKI